MIAVEPTILRNATALAIGVIVLAASLRGRRLGIRRRHGPVVGELFGEASRGRFMYRASRGRSRPHAVDPDRRSLTRAGAVHATVIAGSGRVKLQYKHMLCSHERFAMDALSLLKEDHRKVDALLKEASGLGSGAAASRQKLFKQIDDELTIHSKIEETIFYPALKSKAKSKKEEDAKQEVLEAYEEHGNIAEMLRKLEGLDPKDETYAAKIQVLSELVKHHVHEEEHEMFKQARELFDKAELQELGEQLERAKSDQKAAAAR